MALIVLILAHMLDSVIIFLHVRI